MIQNGRIVCQEHDIKDYKFFCFNGKVKVFKVDMNRFEGHFANYYDAHGHQLPFGEASFPPKEGKDIHLPVNLSEMITIAEKLSYGLPFLRVDLYNINERIYFSELTFYPASGLGRFTDDEWDKKLGSWLNIN